MIDKYIKIISNVESFSFIKIIPLHKKTSQEAGKKLGLFLAHINQWKD
jgi:hypothetical protein